MLRRIVCVQLKQTIRRNFGVGTPHDMDEAEQRHNAKMARHGKVLEFLKDDIEYYERKLEQIDRTSCQSTRQLDLDDWFGKLIDQRRQDELRNFHRRNDKI